MRGEAGAYFLTTRPEFNLATRRTASKGWPMLVEKLEEPSLEKGAPTSTFTS